MRVETCFGFAAAVLCAVAPLAAQGASAPASKYFTLEFAGGDNVADHAARLTGEAVAAADAAAAAFEKAWQAKVTKKPKLVIHCDEASFRVVEKSASKLGFPVDQLCLPDASAAHLLLSRLAPEVEPRIGLPEPTRQGLMLCAVRLLAMQVAESAKTDPWLAWIVAHGVVESLSNPAGSYGVDPSFDARRMSHALSIGTGYQFELRAPLLVTDAPPTHDAFLAEINGCAVLAQFLAQENAGWIRKLLGKPPKAIGVVPNRLRVFEAIVGKDQAKAQARWRAMLGTLRPVWTAVGHVRATQAGFVLAGAADQVGSLMSPVQHYEGGYVLRCRATIDDVGVKALHVRFWLEGRETLAVVFEQGFCALRELRGQGGWQKAVASAKSPHLPLQAFDLEVQCGSTMRVLVDGKELIAVPAEERMRNGFVGLAVGGSLATVTNLHIGPVSPAKK